MRLDRVMRRSRASSVALSDLGLAVLAGATVLLVSAVLLGDPATSTLTTADPAPSAPPTLLRSAPDHRSASPTATATVTATAASAVAVVAPTPQPLRSPRPMTGPLPPGLRVVLRGSASGPLSARVSIRVLDTDGTWIDGSVSFGDGSSAPLSGSGGCPPGPAPYDATRVLTHTYRHPGSYVVVVTVRTGRPCSGGRTEVATRRVAIEIAGSSPRPPPSASSSATPRPTPARTGSPSAAPTPAEPSASASPEPTGSPHSGR